MQSLYTYQAVEDLISRLTEQGYEHIVLSEGTLAMGDGVLLAPSENLYNFVYREIYLNEWSSAQTIRRFTTISKKLQAEIDRAMENFDAA